MTLTDADREAIAAALQEWKRAPAYEGTMNEAIYAAAVAATIERCARECESLQRFMDSPTDPVTHINPDMRIRTGPTECAAAIRALGR